MAISTPNISFGGLASGLDTRAIIDALVQVERIPMLRLEQRKRALQSQDSLFANLSTKLEALDKIAESLHTLDSVASVTPSSTHEDNLTATANGNAVPNSYDIVITNLAERETFQSGTGFANRDQTLFSGPASYSFDFNVGTDTFTVNLAGDATLDDIRSAINDSGAPVTASVINTNIGATPFELVLTADETGTDAAFTMDFSGSPAGLDTTLNLSQVQAAENSAFTVNGISAASQSNSVSDVIDGVTLKLKVADPTTTITLGFSSDAGDLKEKLNEFIDAYNEVVGILNGQNEVDEDGQTNAVLFGDSSLRHVRSSLRSAVADIVGGVVGDYNNLASLGITTEVGGLLSLDETDFEEALEGDRDSVFATFTTDTGGVGDRLAAVIEGLTNSVDGLIKDRREGIATRTRRLDNRIESLTTRLDSFEARLVKKFAAFESLMAEFQAQQAALGFGGGF